MIGLILLMLCLWIVTIYTASRVISSLIIERRPTPGIDDESGRFYG